MVRRFSAFGGVILVASLLMSCGNVMEDKASGETPGISADEIVIGATLPLTGSAAVAGEGLQAGLKIAAEEINDAGGINGRKVKLVLLDDAFATDRVVTNVRRLVSQENVYALVAPSGSQGLPGAWPFIKESGTPVWGPVSPADPQMQEVYLLSATRANQIAVAIDYYVAQGYTKLGVIQQDNDLGVSMKEALDSQLPKHPDIEIVANETVQPDSTDVSAAVNKVLSTKPEALLLATSNTQVALVLQQVKKQGVSIPVFNDQGGAGTGGPSAVGPAGDAAEGFIGGMQADTVSTDNPDVERWRELAKAYDGKEGESGFSLQTYSFLKSFAELVERMGDDLSYENFHKTAEGLVDDPISLGSIPDIECAGLPSGHTCVQQAGLAEFTGGKWTVLKGFTASD